MLSPTYELATYLMSYGGVSKSSVWDRWSVAMSYGWDVKSSVWLSNTTVQATGLDAWASRVKCPARFVSHLHEIFTRDIMMTSSNGTISCVTGPLCGEFTGPGEFPAQWPVTRSFDVFIDLGLNRINDWVNNREAGDLRRHCGHYDVNIMLNTTAREGSALNYFVNH